MSYAADRKYMLDKLSGAGFKAGAETGALVETYADGDERTYARIEAAGNPQLLGENATVWRCGYMVGFLTRIVDRGL